MPRTTSTSIRSDFSSIGRRWPWLVGCTTCLWLCGCGASDPNHLPVFPATGKISLKGESPAGALIALHPKGGAAKQPDGQVVVPRAQVLSDGTFALSSYNAGDGAPEGEYSVTIEWQKIVTSAGGEPTKGPNLVPKPYAKPETTPLAVTIAKGTNQLPPIVLK